VTPSAWNSSYKAIQVNSQSSVSATTNAVYLSNNFYQDSGATNRYIATGTAGIAGWEGNVFRWYQAASGSAGAVQTATNSMTLDASGNLLVGTTTSSGKLTVQQASGSVPAAAIKNSSSFAGGANFTVPHLFVQSGTDTAGDTTRLALAVGNGAQVYFDAVNVGGAGSGSDLLIYTRASGGDMNERARITSGGEFVVGDTAAVLSAPLSSKAFSGTAASAFKSDASTVFAIVNIWGNESSGNQIFARFATDLNAERGSIDYNRAGGLVRYNTTSDYRAKDIIGPLQNVGATIDALKVYEGVMKGATQSRPMLIAHEAQAHAPYAVSGVKDEMNDDGTPKLQQMDPSSLVPLLLAEIQSLRARVAQLETK